MSADIISFAIRGRMPWQSTKFTAEEKEILKELVYTAITEGAATDTRYEEAANTHTLRFIPGKWEGAPSITLTKQTGLEGQYYVYRRTHGGPLNFSQDFVRAAYDAQVDLVAFGKTCRQEIEQHSREVAVLAARSRLHLVIK